MICYKKYYKNVVEITFFFIYLSIKLKYKFSIKFKRMVKLINKLLHF